MFPSMTFVQLASTIEERALPLKSIETRGSSQKPRMPAKGPSAAFFSAALTSFASVFFLIESGVFASTVHTLPLYLCARRMVEYMAADEGAQQEIKKSLGL